MLRGLKGQIENEAKKLRAKNNPMLDDTKPSNEAARQFLLAEYARFSEAFWRNEETGETRVNWFIGIVTASLAGLAALLTKAESPFVRDHIKMIVLIGLAALLVFGIVTFARMLTRNERTDQYKHAIDSIRQKFQDHFDSDQILFQYTPLGGPGKDKGLKRKLGGLVHNVAAINALVIALGAGVALYPYLHAWPYLLPAIILLLSFGAQYWLARRLEEKAKRRLHNRDPTHAGGVVFKTSENGAAEYLMIHPNKPQTRADKKAKKPKQIDTSSWVLPKGNIEKGESHGDAALREVREEAGVRARVLRPLGVIEYKVKDERGEKKDVRVKFYLMKMLSEGESHEHERDPKWCPRDKAIEELSHEQSREILRRSDLIN